MDETFPYDEFKNEDELGEGVVRTPEVDSREDDDENANDDDELDTHKSDLPWVEEEE